MRSKIIAALLALVLSLVLAAPSFAVPPTHVTMTLDQTTYEPALGEEIRITGTINGVVGPMMGWQDEGGNNHGQMHFSSRGFNLTGTGLTTGTTYRIVSQYNSTGNGLQPYGVGHWENTTVSNTVAIDPDNNTYILRSTIHITYNANGELVVEVN